MYTVTYSRNFCSEVNTTNTNHDHFAQTVLLVNEFGASSQQHSAVWSTTSLPLFLIQGFCVCRCCFYKEANPLISSFKLDHTTEQNHAAPIWWISLKQARWILIAAHAAALPPPHCATEAIWSLFWKGAGAASSQLVIKAQAATQASHRTDCYCQATFVFPWAGLPQRASVLIKAVILSAWWTAASLTSTYRIWVTGGELWVLLVIPVNE